MHTPSSNTLKNLNSLQSIIGKFELGPTSVREFGPTASLNDRFAPKAPFEVLRSNFRCTPESRLNSEIGQCPRVPISDIPAGKRFDWCKLVHIPQSATAVSFDPISRRFRSHFEAARCSQSGRSRTADCSETQTLFLNNRLALLRTSARTML
jgi:hypothetical protein